VTEGMVALLDAYYPGFSSAIDYAELSTPLTINNFTGHYQGAVHGLPGVPDKFSVDWLSPRTPIKNLYLTGADIAGHGIIGAFMAGFLTLLVACSNRLPLLFLIGKARWHTARQVKQ
jgi:all-trans-retinol 13,14-reductase